MVARGGVQKTFFSIKCVHESYPSGYELLGNVLLMCCYPLSVAQRELTPQKLSPPLSLSLSLMLPARFSFMVSCRPSSVNSALVGAVFILPVAALA